MNRLLRVLMAAIGAAAWVTGAWALGMVLILIL